MKFISTFIFLLNSVFSVIVSERDELCVSGPNAACIPFVKTFDNPKLFINYTRLFIGIHGMGSDALNFSNILADTTLIGSCMSNSLIIAPDFKVEQGYNLLGNKVIGNLGMNQVIDILITRFMPPSKQVTVVGFSMGGQAAQRYSLVNTIDPAPRFLLGCASSWTVLDDAIDFRYGLRNFPLDVSTPDLIANVKRSQYLIACGSEDNGSKDDAPGAQIQGAGRVDRAKFLLNNLKQNGVEASMTLVQGFAHDGAGVIGAQKDFLCTQ